MSRRLDRAMSHRQRVDARERIRGARVCTNGRDLQRFGEAGHAVAELFHFVTGLGLAYEIADTPSAVMLSPSEGELAAEWCDRVLGVTLTWYERHFVAVEDAPSAGSPARTSRARE